MRLTARDAKKVGLCVSGQKVFCETHGIDFRRFLREGIDVSELEHIEDDNLRMAIEVARAREELDGRR